MKPRPIPDWQNPIANPRLETKYELMARYEEGATRPIPIPGK
jgi:hypothetical protein